MNLKSIFPSTLVWWMGAILSILIILVGFFFWIFNPFALGRPKDRELIALFRGHREIFEKLRAMAVEDSGTIAYLTDDSLKHSTLSQVRQNEYMSLTAKIRKVLPIGADPNQVTFHFAGGGFAIARSWVEGITYIKTGHEKGCVMVKSLDDLGIHVSDGVYLVTIEPNWYLVYSQVE